MTMPAVMFLLILMTAPLAALVNAPRVKAGAAGGLMLVILPPWRDAEAVLAAARGRPVGPTSAPFAVLAGGEGADFGARLRRAGAWAVLDGTRLVSFCGG